MALHPMMEFHHIMDIHNFIWFVKSLAVLTTYWYKMNLVGLWPASPPSPWWWPAWAQPSTSFSRWRSYRLWEPAATSPRQLVPTSRRGCTTTSAAPTVRWSSQFCNSHLTVNTFAKETFLPQQLKKWKCTPIKLFDIIKVANDFCKSSNFWKNQNVQKSESVSCLNFLFPSCDE